MKAHILKNLFLSYFFWNIWTLFRNANVIVLRIRTDTEAMDDKHLHDFV